MRASSVEEKLAEDNARRRRSCAGAHIKLNIVTQVQLVYSSMAV
jgi:hypothetical protein